MLHLGEKNILIFELFTSPYPWSTMEGRNNEIIKLSTWLATEMTTESCFLWWQGLSAAGSKSTVRRHRAWGCLLHVWPLHCVYCLLVICKRKALSHFSQTTNLAWLHSTRYHWLVLASSPREVNSHHLMKSTKLSTSEVKKEIITWWSQQSHHSVKSEKLSTHEVNNITTFWSQKSHQLTVTKVITPWGDKSSHHLMK